MAFFKSSYHKRLLTRLKNRYPQQVNELQLSESLRSSSVLSYDTALKDSTVTVQELPPSYIEYLNGTKDLFHI